jgi:hypothetical protein
LSEANRFLLWSKGFLVERPGFDFWQAFRPIEILCYEAFGLKVELKFYELLEQLENTPSLFYKA